jgi:cellulose biosynthesis protein BcsQ
MLQVFGVATRKGGQGKSTTVATLARLCALYGARVLVVDLAQPGTATASLRNIWPDGDHTDLSGVLLSFQLVAAGAVPPPVEALAELSQAGLPVRLHSQPSWSGGYIGVLPWDELEADAAAFLHSEGVLAGLLGAVAGEYDLALIDFPAEGGPLMTNALAATSRVIVPLVAETPALEGLEAMLRLLGRVRANGHAIGLGGILLTRCDPKNKRVGEVAQTILHSGEVEGEPLGRKLFPFAVKANEFFEQAFRSGEPVWERTSNPSHWSAYVLLAEWVLREARLAALVRARRGPALLPPETRILDVAALMLADPEVRLADFEAAHGASLR